MIRRDPADYRLHLNTAGSARRAEMETILRDGYRKCFDARLDQFMPWLVSLERNGKVIAVVGLRDGNDVPMLLESYLDRPVQDVIGASAGRLVARSRIVEVGSLVSVERGACLHLFVLLACLLEHLGYQWMVFTATGKLTDIVRHFGMSPTVLGEARADAVDASIWGSYYETNPRVLASTISEMMQLRHQTAMFDAIFRRYSHAVAECAACFPIGVEKCCDVA